MDKIFDAVRIKECLEDVKVHLTAAGQEAVVPDCSDLTAEDAARKLKESNLQAKTVGTGDRVTDQIPFPGQSVSGGSEVLLYLGESLEERMVSVPDFAGMNRQQAAEAAGKLGLYLLISGNTEISPQVTAAAQSIPRDTQVPMGTTITLHFTDRLARD